VNKKVLLLDFYHATLCVSAVFAVTRCPSVTLAHCMQMAEDIVKLRYRPGSPIILVFLTPSAGTRFQGAQNTRSGWENFGGKILRFSTEIAVYVGNGTR